jgi:L-ascorbate metabolism protein UlaG (beta-lactamase superfamily)
MNESDEPASAAAMLTWVGHATVLLDVAGLRILTDPALTRSLAHLRRRRPAPALAPVDVVAISHVHMDHFHRPSLRRVIGQHTHIVVPRGSTSLLPRGVTGTVAEVGEGELVQLAGATCPVAVEAVHAEHSDRRGPHSRVVARPLGYVVRCGGRSVYFAGDTDLFDGMSEIGPVDIALLPIWGWGPTLGERHLDPVTAAEATHRLDARHVVPIHWGTYSPVRARPGDPPWLDRPIDAFRAALAELDLGDRLIALLPGGSTPVAAST